MLAERGERLDESVDLLKKALADRARQRLVPRQPRLGVLQGRQAGPRGRPTCERAAEQLQTNSVIQDHYGDVLFKLSRYDDAIAAWNRAIGGDGDSIDRAGIDKKIKSAKQKLGKK